MAVFYSLLIALTIALTALVTNTFESFKNYGIKSQEYSDYQTTALASATRVAKESGKFLTELKTHVVCIDSGSAETTPESEVDCSEDKSPAQSLEDLVTNLEDHSENQLNKTILFGLKNKQDYKIELLHSEYIPAQFTEEDKKYISTLLKSKAGSETGIEANELKNFAHEDKLKISGKLLEKIFTPEKLEQVKNNQANYGLVVSDEGLDYCDLPNGLKLKLNKNEILRSKDDDNKNYMSQLAVAQIRLGEVEEKITIQPPVCTPGVDCTCEDRGDCPNPPPPPPPPLDPATRLELALSVMPLSQRGFLFDANQAINKNNPLQIINKREGGYSSVFVQDDGFLRVSIGSITTSLSSNKLLPVFENAELSFDTVTLSFTENQKNPGVILSASDSSNLNIVENKRIEIDIVPRGRTTYTTVARRFEVNGVTIPPGAIVVAAEQEGVNERLAEIGEYEHFRVYSPNTGRLITSFGQKGLIRASCDGGKQCFDVKKFATAPGTTQNGAKVFYTFSAQDLMPNLSPLNATEAWAKIQLDLEQNLQGDLNAAKEEWLKDELKKLNADFEVYTGNAKIDSLTFADRDEIERLIDVFESGGIEELQRSLGINLDEIEDLSRLRYSGPELESIATKLDARNTTLALFALNKFRFWIGMESSDGLSPAIIERRKSAVTTAKESFIKANDDYNAFLKQYGNSPNVLGVSDLESLLRNTSLSNALRQEYTTELNRLKAEEEAKRKQQEEMERIKKEAFRNVLLQQIQTLNTELANLKALEAQYLDTKAKLKAKGKSLETINGKIKQVRKQITNKELLIQATQQTLNNL